MLAAVLAALVPSLVPARSGSLPEPSARSRLRSIAWAQEEYRLRTFSAAGFSYAPSLSALALIHSDLAAPLHRRYAFRVVSAGPHAWRARAVPLGPGPRSRYSFGIDERGQLYTSAQGPVRFLPAELQAPSTSLLGRGWR